MHIFQHIYSTSMFPTRRILPISRLQERAKNPGVWLSVCVFSASFFLFSCSASHSSSDFEQDKFLGSLTIKKQFGNFIDARAISIDAFGNVYIADKGAPGIIKFNNKGDSI